MIVDLNLLPAKGDTRQRRSRRWRRARRAAMPTFAPLKSALSKADLDLDGLLEGSARWVIDCLKQRGSFHNLMALVVAREDVQRVAALDSMLCLPIDDGQVFDDQPDDLAVLFVPIFDVSAATQIARLAFVHREHPEKLKSLAGALAVMDAIGHPDPPGIVIGQLYRMMHCEPQDIVMAHIRELTKLTNARAVISMLEMWTARHEDVPPGFRGSYQELPTSRERVVVTLITRRGPQRTVYADFRRLERPGQRRGTGRVLEVSQIFESQSAFRGRLTEVFDENDKSERPAA